MYIMDSGADLSPSSRPPAAHAAHAAAAPSTSSLTSLAHADEGHFVDYEELRRRQLLESSTRTMA